jgi:hypothetical protein
MCEVAGGRGDQVQGHQIEDLKVRKAFSHTLTLSLSHKPNLPTD